MNSNFLDNVMLNLHGKIDGEALQLVKEVVEKELKYVRISALQDETKTWETYLELFVAAKSIEGCSDKSLVYYKMTISKLFKEITERIQDVTTNDIRNYLARYQDVRKSSKVTIDNMRRIFSSFFSWLEDEDYILKSPVRRIHKVKSAKVVKEAYSDEEMEQIRDNCKSIREIAIVDFLSSTGVRVGELVGLDIDDISFTERSCIVLGKGNSEREVYFDARTKLHLIKYLERRHDGSDALFVGRTGKRISISSVENMLRKLGKRAGVAKVHPHKFRRTLATRAIDKGMPIEQVQKLLGHVRIDTTMHYAMVNQNNVKHAHRKFIG